MRAFARREVAGLEQGVWILTRKSARPVKANHQFGERVLSPLTILVSYQKSTTIISITYVASDGHGLTES
jgi:hypothetical protein